jgi:tungstate transport system ATP-binding protein
MGRAGDDVAFGLENRCIPADQIRGRVDAALAAVEFPYDVDHRTAALSGGEKQRLALAGTLALGPNLLLLDEPTANLDPSAKKEVESLLQGFAAEGMTLVMSTHNLGQAKRLATRVVYLDRGEVRLDLPTAQFFGPSADERARLFLKGELPWTLE